MHNTAQIVTSFFIFLYSIGYDFFPFVHVYIVLKDSSVSSLCFPAPAGRLSPPVPGEARRALALAGRARHLVFTFSHAFRHAFSRPFARGGLLFIRGQFVWSVSQAVSHCPIAAALCGRRPRMNTPGPSRSRGRVSSCRSSRKPHQSFPRRLAAGERAAGISAARPQAARASLAECRSAGSGSGSQRP